MSKVTSVDPFAAAREHSIVCDEIDLGLLEFAGPDAAAFLQSQLSSDVAALVDGRTQLSSYNSPKGRMLANLYLWRAGPDRFRALVAADLSESIRRRLSLFVLRAKLTITDLSAVTTLLGVAGARANESLREALNLAPGPGEIAGGDLLAAVSLPGGRVVVITPAVTDAGVKKQLAAHASGAASSVWRWLGIRAGVPLIDSATQDLFVVQTTNWDVLGGVSFQKGCYPGQEIVARMQYLGRLKERLQLFHAEADSVPGTKLYGSAFGDQACGTIVNAATAPVGGSDLLAVVQLAALATQPLHAGTPSGPVLTPLPLPYPLPDAAAPHRHTL
ncbi:MAG: folate-binding protein YgfZ [Betaproteobacteria bacterium]|nr:folate-binding protein YgfZ [Betaproteobacteria bacterium]